MIDHRELRCGALAGVLLLATACAAAAAERERLQIVGSKVVFPLAVAAAEAFHLKTGRPTPVVEANGTGEGFALFCAGKGAEHPDIATAERRMTASEQQRCRSRGISVAEIKIGHRAVVVAKARRGPALALAHAQLFQALAAQLRIDGRPADNPYRLWSDIDFSLPVTPIAAFGPPPTSAQRGSFDRLIMAKNAGAGQSTQDSSVEIRGDGVFTEVPADDPQSLSRLEANPAALGIFGFTFALQNSARLQAVAIDGVIPSAETIADGRYGPAEPLYIYVKREQIGAVPGLAEYAAEISSEAASGDGGYLVRLGLVPLPPGERDAQRQSAARLPAARM
ncbi:substrate-binding domain-containing protein [Pelagibius sp.]|uniref:substrate-binding domain-containing protein n=1 Tax=Pelagibius sp. TaxID=1931238 RepID=UPI0026248309|nr:substrate-binding domain-containing protein [Pelagibius sp.]